MAEAADFQGTPPSAARRWLRRSGALLAAVPVLAGLLQAPAAGQARADVPAAASETATAARAPGTGSRSVDVSVDALTPSAPQKGDTITVTGSVTNRSSRTVTEGSVGLRLGTALGGRSAIDNVAQRKGYVPGLEGTPVDDKFTEKISSLAPGNRQSFRISVPADDLDLGQDGVYQLGVALTGQTAAQPYPQVLGIRHTFLPWQPDKAASRTKTTFMWPLISATHLTAETDSSERQTPVFEDDELAKEIAPGGRLQQMVSLGSRLDVTWVIDPDLLASVDAMTENYLVRGENGETTPGEQQGPAKQWLNELEKAVKGKNVVALPFADPDLASLAHTGKRISGSLSHLKDATEVAADTVETVLHVKASTDFAWPVEGAIDPAVVDVATSAGARNVIARADSLQDTSGLPYTPSAPRPIGGGTTAVVADARLSTGFRGDMTRANNSTLAVQQFLAQSLMITLQAPEKQRSVVVAPQRTPTAGQAQSMAQAIRLLQDGRWTESQDLTAAAKSSPDPGAVTAVPSGRAYPASLRRQELPLSAFESIRNTQGRLDGFQAILSNASRVQAPFGRAIDREMSTSWRGGPQEAERFRGGVSGYLNTLTQSVSLIDKSEAKLSGRSATIPVTVQNNLLQDVDHLVLRLTSTKATRLKVGGSQYDEQPVRVSGGHAQSVKFTTTAEANGPVEVIAQLYTQDGQPYGSEVRFNVNVTEVTPTVMLVIAGGVLLLVLAGFRMYTQRKRAARRAGDGPPEGPGDGSDAAQGPGPGTDTPGQPSDPEPDTAAENEDASTPGERVDR
ncbi:hypothetical protein DUI70_3587 [Streptomyces albus]|nr:hypothetical protein DUI70_3587 [Streptomyces albus]